MSNLLSLKTHLPVKVVKILQELAESEPKPIPNIEGKDGQTYLNKEQNQLLQLCTARKVFSTLVTVRLYTVMPEVCRWLANEKQRKTDIRLTDQ